MISKEDKYLVQSRVRELLKLDLINSLACFAILGAEPTRYCRKTSSAQVQMNARYLEATKLPISRIPNLGVEPRGILRN